MEYGAYEVKIAEYQLAVSSVISFLYRNDLVVECRSEERLD